MTFEVDEYDDAGAPLSDLELDDTWSAARSVITGCEQLIRSGRELPKIKPP